MTTPHKGTDTPQTVKELATQQVHLPRLTLIGVFGNIAAPQALIRTISGDITRISVGDSAAGGIVTAIGPSKVIIANRNGTKVLALPAA